MLLAGLIFFITLIFIIWQPKGLQIGTTAVIGALVALVLGVVSIHDIFIVIHIVWDATLSFIGIILLSMVLDEIGFFEWCAIKMAKLSRGSGNLMFIYSLLLGGFVAALFANDGAALILTPILLSKMKLLKLNTKTMIAFLLAGGFISDSTSLPFVFSNLTNIVTVKYFNIGFTDYLLHMFIPYLVSILVSIAFLWLFLHKNIPEKVDVHLLKDANSVLKSRALFNFSWIFLLILFAGYFVGDHYNLPISVFALGGGVVFLIIASLSGHVKAWQTIKIAPWQIVWFSIGLYIVVYGLKNAGLTVMLSNVINHLDQYGKFVSIIGTGFLSAVLSAVMNNMPTIMIMDIALAKIHHQDLIYANIIGCNLGPKMTPFGSLATLLWLHVLSKKGVKINFWQYSKFGLIITPPILFIVLSSLLIK